MTDQATVHPAPAGSPASTTTRRWRTEDWIAVLLGFIVITAVLAVFQWKIADLRNVVPTFRWTTDSQIVSMTPAWVDALDAIAKDAQAKGQQNVVDLSNGLKAALGGKDRKGIETAAGRMAALGSRTLAGALGAEIRGHAAATIEKIYASENLLKVLYVAIGF